MRTEPRTRVLILVFDGLRPDMVTEETMPVLRRFADEGVWYPNARAVFPSETRVNQASLVTGCMPQRHGIVGNKFLEPKLWPDRLVNSGDEEHLFAAHQALGGDLLDVPSLGERLADAGYSLAVVGSGTPGGTRILHHRAEELRHFRLSLYRPDRSTPSAMISQVIDRFGPIPEQKLPAVERLRYATDVYLDFIARQLDPDVAILWSFEPDYSYHYSGLGTPANLAALRCADSQLERILRWRDVSPQGDTLQIITLSDHGHLATSGESLNIGKRMRSAGWHAGSTFDDETDIVMFCSTAGGCYLKDRSPERIAALASWLREQDWCGPVIASGVENCLDPSDVAIAHRRAPDVVFVAKSDNQPNGNGLPGRSLHNTGDLPPGGGMHGGLHRLELNNWLALGGSAYRSDARIESPAGIVDVLPTIFATLGLTIPADIDGRPLHEVMDPSAAVSPITVSRSVADHTLHTVEVDNTSYLQELVPTGNAVG